MIPFNNVVFASNPPLILTGKFIRFAEEAYKLLYQFNFKKKNYGVKYFTTSLPIVLPSESFADPNNVNL